MLAALAPFLVPAAIGAVGSGLQAAGQGKNPLEIGTASLIGAGLGAGFGAGGRMAGQLLANTGLATKLAPAAYKAGQFLAPAAQGSSSLINPLAQQMAGRQVLANVLGGTAATVGSLAVPAMASGLAGVPGSALRAAGGGARNVAGAGLTAAGAAGLGTSQAPGVYDFEGNALPSSLDPTFGAGSPLGSMADVMNPAGRLAANRIAEEKEADTQLNIMQKQAAKMAPWLEGAKKAELARQLYAATVRGNLATQQRLLVGGIENSRAMGLNAANQIGSALASQYQYS